jgi:hypothetical protein
MYVMRISKDQFNFITSRHNSRISKLIIVLVTANLKSVPTRKHLVQAQHIHRGT